MSISLIRKIISYGIDNLTMDCLKGMDEFHDFSWGVFKKDQFVNLLRAFAMLDQMSFFSNLTNQEFVFFYENDVAEFDIVSVLENQHDKVFLDVECKNDADTDSIREKIDEQLENRVANHLPQFLNGQYILIGILNSKFYKMIINSTNSSVPQIIENPEQAVIRFVKFESSEELFSVLIGANEINYINQIINQIRSGSFRYYPSTLDTINYMFECIKNHKISLVFGDAGSGKTVIALSLFFKNILDSKLLIINSKFYYSMKLGGSLYFYRKTFINSKEFVSCLSATDVAIVDECQRLDFSMIKEIASKAKNAVFFGDDRQAFTPGSYLDPPDKLKKDLQSIFGPDSVYLKKLQKSRRYPNEVDRALNYITSISSATPETKITNDDYKILAFFDSNQFLKAFDDCHGNKKVYTTIDGMNQKSITIGSRTFNMAPFNMDDYSNQTFSNDDFVGNTYHALSFDVEHSFIFLPTITTITYHGQRCFAYQSLNNSNDILVHRCLNELNVLFTRGRKSLYVYFADISAYLLFKAKIKDIIK